jgi:predicted phosphoadenosine phosphosulfate sulfurtransferase
MARYKGYIDNDVLTEAKIRIRHIYNTHDTIVVLFSGGKDSLVLLHLIWEIAQERGLKKIPVVFRDEEIIPDEVINFVNGYRKKEWIEMYWFAVELINEVVVLGDRKKYIAWDKNREWVRPMPTWAINNDAIGDQHELDDVIAENFKGKVAFCLGVRADESLVRYRSLVGKLNDNYINRSQDAPKTSRVWLCKPIFDWSENDVLKYIMNTGIKLCPVYQMQALAGQRLRVSTPLHSESGKSMFGKQRLRKIHPDFYNRILKIFPDMAIHERYYKDYDAKSVMKKYLDKGLEGIKQYIEDQNYDPYLKQLAIKKFLAFSSCHRSYPNKYPLDLMMSSLVKGNIDRGIIPINKKEAIRRKEKNERANR